MDTDAGSDAQNGTTWALAKLTHEGLLSVMSAGDRGWIQGSAADDSLSDRVFTNPGTTVFPCVIIGVVDGTTNEPPVLSDIAVTLPVISTTGADPDMDFIGNVVYSNLKIVIGDRGELLTAGTSFTLINGHLALSDRFAANTYKMRLINTVLESVTADGILRGNDVKMLGGSKLSTAAACVVGITSTGVWGFYGVDFSGQGTTPFIQSGTVVSGNAKVQISNCSVPTVFNLYPTTPLSNLTSATVIACSDTSSQAADSSIQDYEYEDAHGTIDLELTAVRTGGADDGASGAFAYAMTPSASGTLESSSATLKSPWMSVWVAAGSQTLTVYIANDSASTDYLQDEVWCEFYTPDAGDTAQHDQTFDPANARLFLSSTAVTDDTGSTWGTGGNNHQKMSAIVVPGFEGWAYARLHLAKRQATPDTLFLDPKIGVV